MIKFADINGLKTEYITLGKGRDLLFLHGGSVSFRTNLPFIKELSKNFRVWAFSFPGAGKSCKLPKGWKFEDYPKFVYKFIREFSIDPIITGHSVGGAIAIKFNIKYPKLAHDLFLFAPVGMGKKDASRATFQVTKNHLRILLSGKRSMRNDILLNILYHPFDLKKIIDFFREIDIKDDLRRVNEKVVIFWGKEDRVLPVKYLKEFKKYIKRCKSYVVEGGHEFLAGNRKKINSIILDEIKSRK